MSILVIHVLVIGYVLVGIVIGAYFAHRQRITVKDELIACLCLNALAWPITGIFGGAWLLYSWLIERFDSHENSKKKALPTAKVMKG